MYTGLLGKCEKCGWGHDAKQFAMLGYSSVEEYRKSVFANRVLISGKVYCPDCARHIKGGHWNGW